jgi:hypothetical protein
VVYAIECQRNGRTYVGCTGDVAGRGAAHRANPPVEMAADAQLYQPFDEHFRFYVLERFHTQYCSWAAEVRWIKLFKLRGCCYNALPGKPGWSKKFWATHGARKRRGV